MNHKLASAKYIAGRYLKDFRSVRGVDMQEFQEKVHAEFVVDINKTKVYKVKAAAIAMLKDNYKGAV